MSQEEQTSTAAKAQTQDPPVAVNSMITDAVTQANVKVLGDAPAMALANLYQATAQALANTAHNATAAQQNSNVVLHTATTQGVAMLYGIDTTSSAEDIAKILVSREKSGS